MREFRSLDLILLTSGCKIFLSSTSRIADRIQKSLLTFVLFYSLTRYFPWLKRHGVYRPFLVHTSILMDIVFALFFLMIMTIKRDEMRILLETLIRSVDGLRSQSLRQYSLLCSIVCWFVCASKVVWTCYYVFGDPHGFDKYLLIAGQANQINWLFGGICVYGFFVKCITYVQEEYFNRLELIVTRNIPMSVNDLAVEYRSIQILKGQIVSCFGPIPCFWLLHVFIRSAAILSEVKTLIQVMMTITLAVDVSALGWLIFQCDSSMKRAKERSDRLMLELMRRDESGKWTLVMNELDAGNRIGFTAWNVCCISRTLIPGFIHSLLGFVVIVKEIVLNFSDNIEIRTQTYQNMTSNKTIG